MLRTTSCCSGCRNRVRTANVLLWLQVKAKDHKVDCGSYRGRLRFIRMSA